MPNPVWHASLPQSQFIGTTVAVAADSVVRFAPDAGPSKTRPRYTSAARGMALPLILTNAQKVTFDTFYATTLKQGALEFDWTDPATDTAVTMRFTAPPQFTMRASSISGRRWEGTLNLEMLP